MKTSEPSESRAGLALLLVFGLLASGISIGGAFYYRNYEQHYRSQVEKQLSAIAELKVSEMVQWRKERLGDANILFKNGAFSGLVRRFLENPEDANARQQLQTWMNRYQSHLNYERVFLTDTQGVIRMSAPEASPMVVPHLGRDAAAGLSSGQIAFLDLHRDSPDGSPHMAIMVPIFDEQDGRRPLGLIAMRIDPANYLYPLIRRWPTPSQTAETLLVRKEGNEAVFLNELRFQTNTALNLRTPLDRTTMPAVQAALGREGIFEGMDYRGMPVVSALRTIPDSPWSLVARMDAAEVYAPLRAQLWQVILMIGVLLFGAGASAGLVWRHQRSRFYREQYQMSEAMRASELRYRRLFETAKDGILILDAETGMVVDVNPFLIEMLGYSHEVFLGKKVWELGFFKDIIANEANFVALQQKEYVRYEDMPLETADGRRIEVEFISNVYRVNSHKVIQCNIRDISDRVKAERALHREQEFVRSLLDNIAAGVVACDAKGTLVLFNRTAREWHGMDALALPPEEWGRHYNLYGPDGTTPLPTDSIPLLRAFRGETIRDAGMTIAAKDQPLRHILASGSPFYDTQHNLLGAVAAMRDITEQKRAQEALQRSAVELQEKNTELERFLYTASHDLKSPVVTVRTFLGYLELDMASADAGRIEKDLRFIRSATDKMGQLLDELLEVSRVGRVVNPPVRVTLRKLVDEALGAVAGRIAERGVTVKASETDMLLCGDRPRLAEIWQNLVENSCKFMGAQKEPRIEIGVEARGAETVFFVRDNGIGIDPRYQAKIFNLFEKLDPKAEGTGLGLALVKRIVELYQGRIWVESLGKGQGACFCFTLPGAVGKQKTEVRRQKTEGGKRNEDAGSEI